MALVLLICALGLYAAVQAAPSSTDLNKRQAISALSFAQIDAFKPFTFFAAAAYCQPSTTISWSCGASCNANADFVPTASGGDGGDVQFWYVGFSPSLSTVIVSYQGTDTSKIVADLTDVDFFLEELDQSLFPGVPTNLKTHSGFQDAHARSAPDVLAAVQQTISEFSANQVTIVGHSLGGALALVDSVFLPLHVSGVSVKTITFGMPRVGNPDFATYVDSHASLTHINNKEDPVPILPGRFLGFAHPDGEVHITDSEQWLVCPGHDNTSNHCSTGDVPNIFESDESDHSGPYNGVTMEC